jgi:hypothetical protein
LKEELDLENQNEAAPENYDRRKHLPRWCRWLPVRSCFIVPTSFARKLRSMKSLFLSSPKVIKRASLGYDGLMACIYWTRAVQYFGYRHHYFATSYNQLAPLLEITTHLDPHLVVAYEFGTSFLAPKPPHGAGEPERAIELMEYGIQNNPDNWKLYYDLGFRLLHGASRLQEGRAKPSSADRTFRMLILS